MIFKPGSRICNDKYRVEKLAGRGAFAEVYYVTHLRLRAPRAVKVLRMEMPGVGSSDFRDMRQRFELEAELGARLDHPNIVKVHDFEEYEGELYLVMEYASGGSLAERIKEKGPLDLDEALRLALEVCEGLDVIHNKLRVVHRDLKPSNILFGEGGTAKVGDLGLAQMPGGLSQRSLLGSLSSTHPGTPEYMAPEQEGTRGYLLPTADLFAFGCVLFEALSGEMYKSTYGTPLREIRPELPAWLEVAVSKLLKELPGRLPEDERDPTKRYRLVGSVRRDLLVGWDAEKAERRRHERIDAELEIAEALLGCSWELALARLKLLDDQLLSDIEEEKRVLLTASVEERLLSISVERASAGAARLVDPSHAIAAVDQFSREIPDLPGLEALRQELGQLSEDYRLQQDAFARIREAKQIGETDPEGVIEALKPLHADRILAVLPAADRDTLAELDRQARGLLLERERQKWLSSWIDDATSQLASGDLEAAQRSLAVLSIESPDFPGLAEKTVEVRDAVEQKEKQARLKNLFAQAEQSAQLNPEKALGLLREIERERQDYPGLSELRQQADQALSEQARQKRLAELVSQAQAVVWTRPLEAFSLLREIERISPSHPDLPELKKKALLADQLAKAREALPEDLDRAQELLVKVKGADLSAPGLAELEKQVLIALREREKQRELNGWFSEAEKLSQEEPEEALELVARISAQSKDYPGLKTLKTAVEGNIAEQKRQERHAAEFAAARRLLRSDPKRAAQKLNLLLCGAPDYPELAETLAEAIRLVEKYENAQQLALCNPVEALALIESLQVDMPEHPGLEKLRRKAQRQLERETQAEEKAHVANQEKQAREPKTKARLSQARTRWLLAGIALVALLLVLAGLGWGFKPTVRPTRAPESGALGPVVSQDMASITSTSIQGASAAPTEASTPQLGETLAPTLTATAAPPEIVYAGTPMPQTEGLITADNAGLLAPMARWGKGMVNQVLYSPKGDYLAVASDTGIYLYDKSLLKESHWIFPKKKVVEVDFSPNGEYLGVGLSPDLSIRLWQISNNQPGPQLKMPSTRKFTYLKNNLGFTSDNKNIALIDPPYLISWNVNDGNYESSYFNRRFTSSYFTFSPFSDDFWVAGTNQGGIEYSNGVLKWKYYNELYFNKDYSYYQTTSASEHYREVTSLDISSSGTRLISGSLDKTVKIWEIQNLPILIKTLSSHDDAVTSVKSAPNEEYFASSSKDNTVQLRDFTDFSLINILKHPFPITSISIAPDSLFLGSAATDGIIRIWNTSDGKLAHTIDDHKPKFSVFAYSPAGTVIASGDDEGWLWLWIASDGTLLGKVQAHEGAITNLAISASGEKLATSGEDRLVKEWDFQDWSKPNLVWENGNSNPPTDLAYSPDGELYRAYGEVTELSFTPDGVFKVSGLSDGTLRIKNIKENSDESVLPSGSTEAITALAVSPNSRMAAAGSAEKDVRVWQLSDPEIPIVIPLQDEILSLSFSSDSALLAVASADGKITFWDYLKNERISSIEAPGVQSLSFSPDGMWLAGSDGQFLTFWGIPEQTAVPTSTQTSQSSEQPPVVTTAPSETQNADSATTAPLPQFIEDEKGVRMALVPSGEFLMGSENGSDDEKPVHSVFLDNFYLDIYEVTNRVYLMCVEASVCSPPLASRTLKRDPYFGKEVYHDYPVVMINWKQASELCEWRRAKLPTEAEWGKAARGELEGMTYPWGYPAPICRKRVENGAKFNDLIGCYFTETDPVGSFAPNGYGLYDMAGNVLEWVSDWYRDNYYSNNENRNPTGPLTGKYRVLRGGSWQYGSSDLGVATRHWRYPDSQAYDIGFRCARTP